MTEKNESSVSDWCTLQTVFKRHTYYHDNSHLVYCLKISILDVTSFRVTSGPDREIKKIQEALKASRSTCRGLRLADC